MLAATLKVLSPGPAAAGDVFSLRGFVKCGYCTDLLQEADQRVAIAITPITILRMAALA